MEKKLLIVTQKIDRTDNVLGSFHEWVKEFARHYSTVTVIALYVGEYNLPPHVNVLSLGKEKGVSRLKYLYRFFKYIIQYRDAYDQVFVHMNQVYVMLAGWLWKHWHKKIALWYTHRQVDFKLRIAEKYADVIFTAAKESFNVPSTKVKIVGHGIRIERFVNPLPRIGKHNRIVSVGRISAIKNLETLVEAANILRNESMRLSWDIIGPADSALDKAYEEKIKKDIVEKKLSLEVAIHPPVPNLQIARWYWQSDLAVNLTPTGGIDRVVLEAIIAGAVPLVSNQAFRPLFGEYADDLIFTFGDPADLAKKIRALYNRDLGSLRKVLADRVVNSYDVRMFIDRVVDMINHE